MSDGGRPARNRCAVALRAWDRASLGVKVLRAAVGRSLHRVGSVFFNAVSLPVGVRKHPIPASASGHIMNSVWNVAVCVIAAPNNRNRVSAWTHPSRVIAFRSRLTLCAIQVTDWDSEKLEICVSHFCDD